MAAPTEMAMIAQGKSLSLIERPLLLPLLLQREQRTAKLSALLQYQIFDYPLERPRFFFNFLRHVKPFGLPRELDDGPHVLVQTFQAHLLRLATAVAHDLDDLVVIHLGEPVARQVAL